jgi:hypothetical protein
MNQLQDVLQLNPNSAERHLNKFAHTVGFASRKHEIVWLILLEHAPHALNVITGFSGTR